MMHLDHDRDHVRDDVNVGDDDNRCVQGWYPVSSERRRVAGFARQVCGDIIFETDFL